MSTRLISASFLLVLVSFALCEHRPEKVKRIDIPRKLARDCHPGLDCINDRCQIGIKSNYEKVVPYYPDGPRCDAWVTHWCADNYYCKDNRCYSVFNHKMYDPAISTDDILKEVFQKTITETQQTNQNLRGSNMIVAKNKQKLEELGIDVAKLSQQVKKQQNTQEKTQEKTQQNTQQKTQEKTQETKQNTQQKTQETKQA